uniref:Mitochondrial S-adenosylmethionine carrier protein n=1 Tax=Salmo trutta TaxID=8032 RepID=A0A673Z942_SALTR
MIVCLSLHARWGAVLGCVDLTFFPLDPIKTRMQSQQGFAKAGSFRGVYAGVPSASIGSFPNDESLIMSLCCSAHNRKVPCLISVPTEEVKQRTQALLSSNTYQVLLATLRDEGVRGLYRGYRSASRSRSQTQWSWRQGHTPFFWQAALCAGVEAFVTNPLDVAKTRIMLAKAGTSVASRNIPLVMLDVLFSGSIPRVMSINLGGFIFLGAYEKVRLTLL